MSEKKEILRYSSLLPEKKKSKSERENAPEQIKFPEEDRRKNRIRVGRGRSGRRGKTCGRGQKGQKSRSGYSRRAGFEGGQMPLHRRLPKRGFTSIFKKEYQVINLALLSKAGLTGEITPETLSQRGLITTAKKLIKVLGHGEISGKVDISADAFSGSAKKKIEAASGTCNIRKKLPARTISKAE